MCALCLRHQAAQRGTPETNSEAAWVLEPWGQKGKTESLALAISISLLKRSPQMTCADQVEVGMLGQCWVLLGAGCDELQWRLAGHTALDCPLRLSDRGSMKACVIIPLDAVNIALEAATLQSGGVGSAVIAPSMYGGTSAKMRPPDPTRTHAHLGAGLICRQLADWEEVGTGHRACNALSGRRYAQVPVGAFESERARKHESSVLGGFGPFEPRSICASRALPAPPLALAEIDAHICSLLDAPTLLPVTAGANGPSPEGR